MIVLCHHPYSLFGKREYIQIYLLSKNVLLQIYYYLFIKMFIPIKKHTHIKYRNYTICTGVLSLFHSSSLILYTGLYNSGFLNYEFIYDLKKKNH